MRGSIMDQLRESPGQLSVKFQVLRRLRIGRMIAHQDARGGMLPRKRREAAEGDRLGVVFLRAARGLTAAREAFTGDVVQIGDCLGSDGSSRRGSAQAAPSRLRHARSSRPRGRRSLLR